MFFFLLASVLDVKIKDCVIKKYKTLFTFFEKENFNASVARKCAAKVDDFSELRKINLIDSYCTVRYVLKFAKTYQPNINMQHILNITFFINKTKLVSFSDSTNYLFQCQAEVRNSKVFRRSSSKLTSSHITTAVL